MHIINRHSACPSALHPHACFGRKAARGFAPPPTMRAEGPLTAGSTRAQFTSAFKIRGLEWLRLFRE